MKIDEGAFERAFGPEPSYCSEDRCDWANLRENLAIYLAELPALPSAEPGRDRIAVAVRSDGSGAGWALPDHYVMDDLAWASLEREAHPAERLARAIVRCNLPRPAEPVEVEGSVEGVGRDET